MLSMGGPVTCHSTLLDKMNLMVHPKIFNSAAHGANAQITNVNGDLTNNVYVVNTDQMQGMHR